MSEDQLKSIEAETQNEIDQILNEVEDLRRELGGQTGDIQPVNGLGSIVDQANAAAKDPVVLVAEPVSADNPVHVGSDFVDKMTAEVEAEVAQAVADMVPESAESVAPQEAFSEDLLADLAAEVGAPSPISANETPPPVSAVPAAEPVAAKALSAVRAVAAPVSAEPTHPDDEKLMSEFKQSFSTDEVSANDGGMEGTLAELKADTSVKSLLDESTEDEVVAKETVVAKNDSNSSPVSTETNPSLQMTLTGSMTLKLKYEFAGQEVTVSFTDQFMTVGLADGTEFKIPVGRQKTLRRIA